MDRRRVDGGKVREGGGKGRVEIKGGRAGEGGPPVETPPLALANGSRPISKIDT